jgi:protein phosphatase
LTNLQPDESNLETENQRLKKTALTRSPPERRIGFSTHIGRLRGKDEDSVIAAEVTSMYESMARKRILLLIADGMGGQEGGEIASRIGASVTANSILEMLATGDKIESSTYHEAFSQAVQHANKEILDLTLNRTQFSGMGTTVSLAVIDGNYLHVAHVGDSRVYVINQRTIKQVTKDHSYVQTLVDLGRITVEQARNHPQKNIVTKVLGYYGEIQPDLTSLPLSDEDHILVCCDGLTFHVGDEEIKQIVLRNSNPQNACDELVSLANERGGFDNISLALASAKD